jgi:hypothetical protein
MPELQVQEPPDPFGMIGLARPVLVQVSLDGPGSKDVARDAPGFGQSAFDSIQLLVNQPSPKRSQEAQIASMVGLPARSAKIYVGISS